MLFSMLRNILSTSHQACNVQKRNLYGTLDSCLERFECWTEDEIHFTNPEFVGGIPPFACQFAKQPPISHFLAAADEDGQVFIYDTNVNGPAEKVKDWSAHNNAIFDVAWSPTESRLVTASGDQSAALWDVKTANRLTTFKQHKCSLKSVSFRPWDGHVFASGARDGSIMIWDDRFSKKGKGPSPVPVICVNDAHVDQQTYKAQPKRRRKLSTNLPTINSSYSVSAVLFQKDDVLLSAGSADGIVKVWDVRKMKTTGTSTPTPSHQFMYSGTSNRKRGISSLALTSTRTELFVSCTDSVIYKYDLSGVLGMHPVRRYQGHMNSTFFVKAAVSPDDLYLLSGSSDNSAYIWRIGGKRKVDSPSVTLVGHEAEVTSVTWCPTDFTKVVTCSDDNTMRIWKMSSGQTVKDNGVSRVIGTAKRCLNEVASESQDADSVPSQTSQSVSDSCMSTPTSKTSESPMSPQLSPMPSSIKKRRFSLKEWVTTSPKTSRPSSPVPTPKRLKSESSGGAQMSQKDGGSGTDLKRKVVENSEESGVIKKVRSDVSGDTSTASVTCIVATSEGLTNNSCVSNLVSKSMEETAPALKRANAGESAHEIVTIKKAKVGHTEMVSQQLESRKCFHDRASGIVGKDLKNDAASQRLPTSPRRMPSPKPSEQEESCKCKESDLDKENYGRKDRVIVGRPEIAHSTGQRSPLKDDLPMNRPKCSSASNTKRSLASNFQSSSKTCDGRDENEEAVSPEMQQQNLKECFKEKKKNGGLVQTKRKVITRRIDGYFQPIQKKRPSES